MRCLTLTGGVSSFDSPDFSLRRPIFSGPSLFCAHADLTRGRAGLETVLGGQWVKNVVRSIKRSRSFSELMFD